MLCSGKNFTNKQIPDLSGKVAVVTGGNVGIGYHVALQLARQGCRVYLACRNKERGLAAIESIKKELERIAPNAESSPDIRFLQLNLSNLKEIDAAATQLLNDEPRIHILVNNAGIMAVPYALTDDGIESQFGVNHVGPTLLTQRLFPTIKSSGTVDDPARIVFTSSDAHQFSHSEGVHLTLDKINDKEKYSPTKAYGQSKLANILTANHFAQQAAEDGQPTVLVNSVHPGVVRTEIGRSIYNSYGWFGWFVFKSFTYATSIAPEDGALTTLYAVTSNDVKEKGYNGKYFVPYGKLATPNDPAGNVELQENVWKFTQTIVREKLDAPKW
ncbi:hypothetical protein BDF22DRAFT_617126 [Syncephalis plumigaleata]|nr:hypothetical protein BDF22DRAFT_617126 [Syncephalis plumigaleata]